MMDKDLITLHEIGNDGRTIYLYYDDMAGLYLAFGLSAYYTTMVTELPMARRFKSYVGTKNAAEKLKRWLKDFHFTDIATADRQIAWDSIPHFDIPKSPM